MNQQWTLHIKDFARIKHADITLKPLTLFVGENNSGKSYVATLLWGVIALGKTLYPAKSSESQAYKKCLAFIDEVKDKLKKNNNAKVELDIKSQQLFIDLFNHFIAVNKNKLSARLFGNKVVNIGEVAITSYSRNQKLTISVDRSENKRLLRLDDHELFLSDELLLNSNKIDIINHRIITSLSWHLIASGMSDTKNINLPSVFYRNMGAPLFMPASRTGFMLTYPVLVNRALDAFEPFEQEEQVSTSFTLPVVRFLQALSQVKKKPLKKYEDIATWLEEKLLHGKIEQQEKGKMAVYQYAPSNHTEQPISMYLSSSLVTELTPIVHFLRNPNDYKMLFIEEPEAHLHPAAQRKMALALAKMVNKSLPIVATTHGDTLFQQINNLAVLHEHANKKQLSIELGYTEDDLLDPNDIIAYQFKRTEDETTVSVLNNTEYGIAVPTFNDPLEALLDEVYKIHDEEP